MLQLSFPLVHTAIVGQYAYPDIALHISNYYIIIDIYGGGEGEIAWISYFNDIYGGILYKYHALLIFMEGNCMNTMTYWYLWGEIV